MGAFIAKETAKETAEVAQSLRRLKRTVLFLGICSFIQSITICQLVIFEFKICCIIELLLQ